MWAPHIESFNLTINVIINLEMKRRRFNAMSFFYELKKKNKQRMRLGSCAFWIFYKCFVRQTMSFHFFDYLLIQFSQSTFYFRWYVYSFIDCCQIKSLVCTQTNDERWRRYLSLCVLCTCIMVADHNSSNIGSFRIDKDKWIGALQIMENVRSCAYRTCARAHTHTHTTLCERRRVKETKKTQNKRNSDRVSRIYDEWRIHKTRNSLHLQTSIILCVCRTSI